MKTINSRYPSVLAGISLLIVWMSQIEGAARAEDPLVSMDTIKSAWAKRQQGIRTLVAEWKTDIHIPAGGLAAIRAYEDQLAQMAAKLSKQPPPPPRAKELLPPEAFNGTMNCRLVIDQRRVRYQYSSTHWDDTKKMIVMRPYVSVFADGTTSSLHGAESIGGNHPEAASIKTERHADITDSPLRTITTSLFGLSSDFRTYDLDNFTVTRVFQLEGRQVVELVRRFGGGARQEQLLLDAALDYVPVRVITLDGTVRTLTIDAKYNPHPLVGWVPSGWLLKVCYRDGSLQRSLSATVTEIQINSPVAEGEFRPELPAGTILGETTGKGLKFSLIDSAGNKSPIEGSDHDLSYDELLAKRSGSKRKNWIILGVMIGAACIGTAWLVRKRKRVRSVG